MSLKLSVVDQSPIHDGAPPSKGPKDTLALAKACDDWGYYRYWLAEHHNTPGYASPCPEIMAAEVANQTQRIRVGSGGVLLPHYSPFKVAETFRMLETLHPGRIDLGLGRAPGADERGTLALAAPRKPIDPRLYPQQVADLMGFLHDNLPQDHPFATVKAMPSDGGVPEVWLLGSSGGSAELAGMVGASYALALFIGVHERSPHIIKAYQNAFRPSPSLSSPRALIAVSAICADSDEEAQYLSSTRSMWLFQALSLGRIIPLPTPEEAAMLYHHLSPGQKSAYERILANNIAGTPEKCRDAIEKMALDYAVDEVMIVTVTHSFAARMQSYEKLAQIFELKQS
jgi:luciferase family oxidoreductase group 1